MIHDRIELMRRMRAYPIRVATLFPHFPHALHTIEHVAAPQHVAPNESRVPTLGTAISGIERRAPMATAVGGSGPAPNGRLKGVVQFRARVVIVFVGKQRVGAEYWSDSGVVGGIVVGVVVG